MGSLSLKEKAVVAILGMVLLYALAVLVWFMHSEAAWKSAQKSYAKAKAAYAKECALIDRRSEIYDEYDEEKSHMPTFDFGKSTDTTWLKLIDEIAARNNVFVYSRQAGRETVNDDVLELSIDVKNWEGALESVVRFMHELENTDEGMFDISKLDFKPGGKGYLKGSLSLTCAYMRENKAAEDDENTEAENL